MSFEKPGSIPEQNELPLNIRESLPSVHQGREVALWQVEARTPEGQEKLMALKKIRKEEFSSDEEMSSSKKFYDFLKNDPEFGKFVLDTLYFKARISPEESPSAFRLQKLIEGKRIDELDDDELYKDPDVVKELYEFAGAAIEIFKKAKKEGGHMPDLYGDKLSSYLLFNARHSSNIIIAEKPDEEGRRIFFVDAAPQVRQKEGIGKVYQDRIGSNLQLLQLEKWKKKLENQLGHSSP